MTLCQMQTLKIKGENSLLTLLHQECPSDGTIVYMVAVRVPIVTYGLFWSAEKFSGWLEYKIFAIFRSFSKMLRKAAGSSFRDCTWISTSLHCFMNHYCEGTEGILFADLYLNSILTLGRSRDKWLKEKLPLVEYTGK